MTTKQRQIALKEHLTFGMKRPTVLSQIEGFDLVEGFVLDIMHQFDEGVTKYLLGQLCEHDSVLRLPKSKIQQINEQWLSVVIPGHHNRPPRDILEYKRMKAHELRFFMQHAAPFVLKNILPENVYKVFCHASRVIWLCTKESITTTDINELQTQCHDFLKSFQHYFGIGEMKYSVHLMQHIPYAVELFGPLHILSCYGPEHNIGKISRRVLAMNNTAKHIMNNFNMLTTCALKLNEARNNSTAISATHHAVSAVLGLSREAEFLPEAGVSGARCTFIGKATPLPVHHTVYRLLQERLHRSAPQMFTFQRCKVENGIFVRTRERNEGYLRNECIVCTDDGIVIAVDHVIAVVDDRCVIITDSFVSGHLLLRNDNYGPVAGTREAKIDHIFPATLDEQSDLVLFETKFISKQMVLLRPPKDGMYILSPPSNQFRLS
ncbi:uncharacterized protein LOC129601417 isoform X1 [Paramacrobiotus metropolitanus]|uniref:uncharacterized protein LOC129601417 isoform X1 n=1 Tax=Paramacrobiotus metropolitanus TaxID=2943436 RepID=UPI00244650AF|nr:uncharacterized protein LOC129601417 isoform X1 [Paramacrobiotus metropolitanus]